MFDTWWPATSPNGSVASLRRKKWQRARRGWLVEVTGSQFASEPFRSLGQFGRDRAVFARRCRQKSRRHPRGRGSRRAGLTPSPNRVPVAPIGAWSWLRRDLSGRGERDTRRNHLAAFASTADSRSRVQHQCADSSPPRTRGQRATRSSKPSASWRRSSGGAGSAAQSQADLPVRGRAPPLRTGRRRPRRGSSLRPRWRLGDKAVAGGATMAHHGRRGGATVIRRRVFLAVVVVAATVAGVVLVIAGSGATAGFASASGASAGGSGSWASAVANVTAVANVAGTGARGSAGDGGSATHAQLDAPSGLAVDGRGDLFIADTGNCRVRAVPAHTGTLFGKHVRAGQIVTLAGRDVQRDASGADRTRRRRVGRPLCRLRGRSADRRVAVRPRRARRCNGADRIPGHGRGQRNVR